MTTDLTIIPEISLTEIEEQPRAQDLSIGERLGFARPRVVRELIERNRVELENFGPLAVRHGKSRGQAFTEFWLNEEQALLVATLSDVPRAPEVRAMLIKVFVAWRRGHLLPPPTNGRDNAREARLSFNHYMRVCRMMGITGNQAILSASRATKEIVGVDTLAALAIEHLPAPTQNAAVTPTTMGQQIGGLTAQAANQALCRHDYQTFFRDAKGRIVYEPTAKGKANGGVMMDTGKRHSNGTPVKQLMWSTQTVAALKADIAKEMA